MVRLLGRFMYGYRMLLTDYSKGCQLERNIFHEFDDYDLDRTRESRSSLAIDGKAMGDRRSKSGTDLPVPPEPHLPPEVMSSLRRVHINDFPVPFHLNGSSRGPTAPIAYQKMCLSRPPREQVQAFDSFCHAIDVILTEHQRKEAV